MRASLVRATRTAVRRSGGRPVPPRNYHVTLAFLGNQPAHLCADVVSAGEAVAAEPVDLTLDRFGYWPRPRVFWIGPTECPPALTNLAGDLWERMAAIGVPRETRPFRPHLTLARKAATLPEVPAPSPLIWRVTRFALIESVTERHGAVYTVVATFGCRGFRGLIQ